MSATAYPLQWPDGWPRTAPHKRSYNWQLKKATLETARRHLYDQLRMLGAKHIVLSSNIPLRNDGEFYATQRPDDGDVGIAIYFELRGKPMSMARDCYDNIAQNLRSLGLAVEHMRGLERHGGAHMMERAFSGFSALPPPQGNSSQPAVDWKVEFAPIPSDLDKSDILAIIENRYRQKAKTVHGDIGGNGDAMLRLNLAIEQARRELKP